MTKIEATATVPGTSFSAQASAETLEKAQAKALKEIDNRIDQAVGGIARGGTRGYDYNRRLKDSVVVKLPLKRQK